MEHTFHYLVFTETEQYGDIYHKADADLVIAERDKVIEEQENLIATLKKERDWLAKDRAQAYDDLEKRAQLNIKQKESNRHQKYKRCLAMADMNWWQANRYSAAEMVERIRWNLEEATKCSKLEEKYLKRYHKWLELAERFKDKEAK